MISADAVRAEFRRRVGALGEMVSAGYAERVDAICDGLRDLARDQLALRYYLLAAARNPRMRELTEAQSFAVYADDAIMMRFNLWFPRTTRAAGVDTMYDKYFSIDVPHNHSYDFFTVGLIGPGYASDFFQASMDLGEASAGDVLEFDRAWTDQFAVGHAFFVPKQSVFHVQHYPERFSLSLNLIPHQPTIRGGKQLILASDLRTVETVLYAPKDGPAPAEHEAA